MRTADIHLTLPGHEPALPEPSEREQEEITAAKTRRIARRPRLAARMNNRGSQVAQIGPNHSDAAGWCERMADAFGSPSTDFVCAEVDRLATTLDIKTADREGMLNAALAVLDGQKPKDEIEAMLLIQMAAVHAVGMDFLGRTKRASTIESLDACGRVASRLLARYTQQCDALTSLRRGGKQIVEVKHVYRKRRKPEGGKANSGWFKPKMPTPAGGRELEDA